MNKYEPMSADAPARAKNVELSRWSGKIREKILNRKDYSLSGAEDVIAEASESLGVSRSEILIFALEDFNSREGALPDALEREYLSIVYAPDKINSLLGSGLSFYEAIAKVSAEIRAKGIAVNKDLVDEAVDKVKGLYA